MSLLTVSDFIAAYKTVSPDKESALGGLEDANKFANAIEAAVIARLSTMSVESALYVSYDGGWLLGEASDNAENITEQLTPVYTATQLAAARVQAIDACVDALVAEDGLKVISVEEAVEAIRSVLGGTP